MRSLTSSEAVVIGVEYRSCFDEVESVVAALAPRQFEDAIEPRPHPGVLRGLFAHPFEPIELLGDRRLHAVGRVEVVELGAEFADDVVVALAEFLADRVELLTQEPFALLLVDALAHVVTDRLRDLEFGQVVPGPRVDGVDAVGQVHGAQHDEPIGVGELGPGGHGVGERSRGAVRAQDLGEAARAAQFRDQFERGAQLPRGGVDRRRGRGVGEHLDLDEGRAVEGRVRRAMT